MPVTVNYELKLHAFDTADAGIDSDDPQIVWHDLEADIKATLNAAGSVPVSKAWADKRTLSAGADTIDLTALSGPFASSIDLTGLKVQVIRITADAGNAAPITVKFGSANSAPYNLFGSAGQVEVPAGGAVMLFGNEKLPDVAAGAKDLDVSSSDATAVYRIVLAAG